MNAIKQLIPLLALLALTISVQAQDIHFSNYTNTPLYTNPALTGYMNGNHRLQVVHRNQWSSVLKQYAYQSILASYDFNICLGGDYLSLGLNAVADKAGTFGFTHAAPSFNLAYHKQLSRFRYLSAGAAGGVLHYRIDPSVFTFATQFDGYDYDGSLESREEFVGENNTVLDLAMGLFMYDTEQLWSFGLAMHHLNQPKYSFLTEDEEIGNNLNIRFTTHGSATVPLTQDGFKRQLVVRGMFMAQSLFGDNSQWQSMLGTWWKFNFNRPEQPIQEFILGLSGRISGHAKGQPFTFDAAILSVIYDADFIAINLNYDVNLSKLVPVSTLQGGYELGLTFRFGGQKSDCVTCPKGNIYF